MALTPDDVVTKQFQHVRFKEGFDPDEVDDFLDEIVVEWRKTIEESDELKAENERLKARIAELESSAGSVEAPAEAGDEPVVEASGAVVASSAGIIELAQRLHDEYVADGIAQRDQLISEAQTQATTLVADAEAKTREETEHLERTRETLETNIAELREFEVDYRSQLRSYIEGQLENLDTTGVSTDADVDADAVVNADADDAGDSDDDD